MTVLPGIGMLRDRVDIRRSVQVTDDAGGFAATFLAVATVWARVRELSARATSWRDGRAVEATHVVVLRFRGDLSPGDRLVYHGRTLEVLGTEDLDGRRAYLSCNCSEVRMVG